MMKKIQFLLFLLITLVMLGSLGYFATFTQLPNGIHFIRQSDSLSFVLNYLFFGDDFLKPTNFNLISEQGKAASEFPLIYFISAKLSAIWHQPAAILRVIHALIFFGGLQIYFIGLFKSKVPIFLAALTTLLLFTSTVIVYYSNNYLPDIAALGLTLGGVSLSLKKEAKPILISMGLFTLASLIKVTYGIYPIAFLATLFICKKEYSLTLKQKLFFIVIFLIPVVLWWTYVHNYNLGVNNSYYANRAIPIWKTPQDQITATTEYIRNYWKNSYYPPATQLLLISFILGFFYFFKKIDFHKKIYLGLLFIGIVCFIILFYQKFHDHDYYFMIVVPAIGLLFASVLPALVSFCDKKILKIGLYIFLLAPAVMSYRYVWIKIPQRWSSENYLQSNHNAFSKMLTILEEADPKHLDKILVVGDSTMNGTLYQLERKGYSFPIVPITEQDMISKEILERVDWIVYLRPTGNHQPLLASPPLESNTFPLLIKN
ncbi:MAG: hypothetical protein MUF77_11875 [Leptospira sp.]|nr:hypothetical protein [Leptospira sp.]